MPSNGSIQAASILIVDDIQSNVVLLERVLRDAGYGNLQATTDPFSVCALHQLHQFDLILLDLKMPGMDGFEVMTGLKAIDAAGYAPILAITVEPQLRQRALSSGAKDFIAKPFELMELTSRIYNMLEVRLLYKRLAQLAQNMETIALHDELTGLPNRRLLLDRLHQAVLVSARSGHQASLMFLDLDHFKELNDRWGHDVGDLLLQQVGVRLQGCLREGDSVARIGGDEFVVLLEELSPIILEAAAQAQRVAKKMLLALLQPYSVRGKAHACSASVGLVMFSGNALAIDDLMKMADLAMYEAKAAGRNQSRFYDPALRAGVLALGAPLLLAFRPECVFQTECAPTICANNQEPAARFNPAQSSPSLTNKPEPLL